MQKEHRLSAEVIGALKSLNSSEYDFILSDDIFRYCTEEEKHNILKECGISD